MSNFNSKYRRSDFGWYLVWELFELLGSLSCSWEMNVQNRGIPSKESVIFSPCSRRSVGFFSFRDFVMRRRPVSEVTLVDR